jgi:ABC-2 type transport system permease protein
MRRAIIVREWTALRGLAGAGLAVWMALIVIALAGGTERARRHDEAVARYVGTEDAQLAHYRTRAAAIETVRAGGRATELTLHENEFDWGPTQALYVAAWLPVKVVAFSPPRAALAVGESDLHTQAYEIPIWDRAPRPIVEPTNSPVSAASWRLDLAFLFIYVLPLLLLALSFDLTSYERDEGLIPLVLAQPVSFRTWLFLKLSVRAGVGLLAIVLATSAAWIALDRGLAHLWPLVTWAAAAGLYGSAWLLMAAAVNARGAGVERSAAGLAALWLALIVVMPAVCQTFATVASPIPSRASFAHAHRGMLLEEDQSFDRLSKQDRERLAHEFLDSHTELRDAVGGGDSYGFYSLARLAWHDRLRPRWAELNATVARPSRRQEALASWLRFASPASLLYEIVTEIAGTSRSRYRDVLAQAEAFEARYKAFLWPRIVGEHVFTTAEFDAIPRFTYVEPAWSAVSVRLVAPFAGLVVWVALLGLVASLARPAGRG